MKRLRDDIYYLSFQFHSRLGSTNIVHYDHTICQTVHIFGATSQQSNVEETNISILLLTVCCIFNVFVSL